MNNAPSDHRRWFQFRLRTLMISVTLAAVASWGYWIVWPWWQLRHEQAVFEESVHRLKSGQSSLSADKLLQSKTCLRIGGAAGNTSSGEPIVFSAFAWKNACYCIYYILPTNANGDILGTAFNRVEVYRLPPVPNGYKSSSWVGADSLPSYVWDSQKIIFNTPSAKIDPLYKLIYSDPPK